MKKRVIGSNSFSSFFFSRRCSYYRYRYYRRETTTAVSDSRRTPRRKMTMRGSFARTSSSLSKEKVRKILSKNEYERKKKEERCTIGTFDWIDHSSLVSSRVRLKLGERKRNITKSALLEFRANWRSFRYRKNVIIVCREERHFFCILSLENSNFLQKLKTHNTRE